MLLDKYCNFLYTCLSGKSAGSSETLLVAEALLG